MLIYNVCSTKVKTNNLSIIDLVLWLASVISYKKLGYTLKLYCTSEDIPFLKTEYLYDLYDEIDTDCFDNSTVVKNIDLKKFWSSRKIEAINDQVKKDINAIYSDTDIIMFKKINTSNCDALFWTIDDYTDNKFIIWNNYSKPKNYEYPKYFININFDLNCGIMWFKDRKLAMTYCDEYFKYVVNNDGIFNLQNVTYDKNNIFAANAEQRLLAEILNYNNTNYKLICDKNLNGICENGHHYNCYKNYWKNMWNIKNSQVRTHLIQNLNLIIANCLTIIKNYNKDIYNHLIDKEYLKNYIYQYA